FAGVLKNLDPNNIQTYQVEGVGTVIGGAAVIEPRLDGANMQAILKIFQGKTQLASAPTQVFETTTTVGATTTTSPTKTGTTVPGASTTTSTSEPTTTTTPSGPTTTLAETSATEITRGIFPPKDKTCP
ncbi:MAG: putative LytR family regulatory protein, partial [Acidimicrobiales bacterium]|nr:putative LytR family regulatory protein [Acidimicrobiales bacterium]